MTITLETMDSAIVKTIEKPKNSRHKEGCNNLSLYADNATLEAIRAYREKNTGCTKRFIADRSLEYYLGWFAEEAGISVPKEWKNRGRVPMDLPLPKETTHEGAYFTIHASTELYKFADKLADYQNCKTRSVVMKAIRAYLIDQGYLSI